MEMNEVLNRLPKHLLDFVVDYPYELYTPEDHAVWRYVMRKCKRYLPEIAHESYLPGLKYADIPSDHVPHLYGEERILRNAGWAAVAVDGFVPPSVFMEFQAHNVVVIAAGMRPIDQIEYTPAPDIIHEAAGHTPLIVDEEYADYLRYFGFLGSKAFLSRKDKEIYEATRLLSFLRLDPSSDIHTIIEVENELKRLASIPNLHSEMDRLRRLHWWTVEYGLIGSMDNPKIYGAGLLSSIGEGFAAVKPEVKKVPYTIQACGQNFDITKPQPQLYVTPNFQHLTHVLKEFSDEMSFTKGGHDGVFKAVESNDLSTLVLDSGIEVSGVFEHFEEVNGHPIFAGAIDDVALAFQGKQIEGFGRKKLRNGISVPLGRPIDASKPFWQFSEDDLLKIGLIEGLSFVLEFTNQVKVKGILNYTLRKEGRLVLMSLDECMISLFDRPLFEYPLQDVIIPIGETVISAYQGVADPDAFELRLTPSKTKTDKINYSDEARLRHSLYTSIRNAREHSLQNIDAHAIIKHLDEDNEANWLLTLELLELLKKRNLFLEQIPLLNQKLRKFQEKHSQLVQLIDDGILFLDE